MMTIVNPVISGPSILCPYSNGFILENYDPGATISWSKSSNVNWIETPYGSSAVIESNTNNSEYGWIQATLSEMGPPATILKNFWIGNPLTPTISGPTTIGCMTTYGYNIPFSAVQTSTSTTWSVTGAIQLVAYTSQGCNIHSSSGSGVLTATLSNCNGNTPYFLSIQVYCEAPIASPNPVSDILYIDPNYSGTEAVDFDFYLINDKGEKKKTKKSKGEKVSMIVSDLPIGTYVLNANLKMKNGSSLTKSTQIMIVR